MNRVRQLVSGSRRQSSRPVRSDEQSNNNNSDNNIENRTENYDQNYDDQTTVMESDAFPSDSITLNTFVSEDQTIGDLQRQGYVNRAPTFTHYRVLPFVSIVLKKGFFAFPSEESFSVYKNNKRKFDSIDCTQALGIPLYHSVSLNVMKSMFNRKHPITTIYRYIIYDPNSSIIKLPNSAEFVAHLNLESDESERRDLYKIEFCTVHKEVTDSYRRVEHIFTFFRYEQFENQQYSKKTESDTALSSDGEPKVYSYSMFNHTERRNSDTKVGGLNLQWYGTTGFASPFGSSILKLLILDDNMASLCDQRTMEEYDNYRRHNRVRPLGYLPVWAKYSDAGATIIPKKLTLKLATLEIGESDRCNSGDNTDIHQSSVGIYGIPWETEVLTCMAMVLHEYESRKDKRHSSAISRGSLASSGLLLTSGFMVT
ncbi:hypothetical protein TPHA_0F02220 [Tetrapisispora phaffii CBS 4417]|uniref:Uncharacterized protein n=1 Tax=Tetrapisispora phaffii (strain ATCC 24235 / CBS 4417 / NBRC 1672 / NRRL Y-8282 / UCD 70-5) TaxID=1071381 RepID=G8BVC2_TETPH|nr:hypothetical protein TPHA_0F02220 [Tetrapisispora phaffii CBS 4417]CCE63704.1 hypothetical protein TPHA_0F02220 [Tetrapisispora phaffii CBS 4417]